LLQKAEINVSIAFTLHKQNLPAIKEVVLMTNITHIPCRFDIFTAITKHEGETLPNFSSSDYTYMGALIEKSATEESFEGFILRLTMAGVQIKCRKLWDGGRSSVSLSSNGDVYPHHMFFGNEEFLLGNILENDIDSILKSEKNIFASMTVDDIEECKDCEVKYLCGGGCRFRAYAATGSAKGHDDACPALLAGIKNAFAEMMEEQSY